MFLGSPQLVISWQVTSSVILKVIKNVYSHKIYKILISYEM
jgi:hypothetical protein